MTPALTLNGEANFEWQPAAKATTQLITHVTSKYRRKKCCQAPAKSARLPRTMTVFGDFFPKSISHCDHVNDFQVVNGTPGIIQDPIDLLLN